MDLVDRSRLHRPALAVLFLLSVLVYGWIFDYVVRLQYLSADCFFVWDRTFLTQWLDRPGGLLLYTGRFLRQFFHFEFPAALIISSLVTAVGILLHRIRGRLGHGIGLFHTLAPCLFLLALHAASTFTLGLLVCGGAFLGYLHLPRREVRQGYLLLVTPLLYGYAGGYAWLFVAWVVLGEWLSRPWSSGLALKVLFPALALALPLAVYRWVPAVSLAGALLYPLDLPHRLLDRLLYLYLLLLPLWPAIPLGDRLEAARTSFRGLVAQLGILVVLTGGLLAYAYNPTASEVATYHRLYKNGRWEEILARARAHPSPLATTQFLTDRALQHQGRLLDEIFAYPQNWGTRGLVLSFTDYLEDMRWALYDSELYLEMGHVNAAYRLAYNQENLLGRTYANLEQLAECSLVSGHYAVAAKYLRILSRTLFHDDFARRYQALLDDPAAADRFFEPARQRRPRVELDTNLGDLSVLLAVVESAPRNRLAFDYLMAWCLLDKTSVPIVAAHVGRFREASYAALPRHVQEALLVWEELIRRPVNRQGYAVDPAVTGRLARFAQQARRYPSKAAAQLGMMPSFGDSYAYYYVLTEVPDTPTGFPSWLRLGNELFAQERFEEAACSFAHAVLKRPESGEAHLLLGNTLISLGRPAEAEVHFRQALKLDPSRTAGDAAATAEMRSH